MDSDTPIILARLEGKVDAALAMHAVRLDESARRHDATEAWQRAAEERLRAVESRPVITPAAAVTGAGVLAAVVAALSPLAERLYS